MSILKYSELCQSPMLGLYSFWGCFMGFCSHLGEIRVQKDNSLDFEMSPQIQLVVLADNGLQTAHCRVSISLLDVNDNAPVFEDSNYRTAVWEGQAHNTYIMQVDRMNI